MRGSTHAKAKTNSSKKEGVTLSLEEVEGKHYEVFEGACYKHFKKGPN